MGYVIGVDLGGTQLRAAVIDQHGQMYAHQRTLTHVTRGPQAVIDTLLGLVEHLRLAVPDDQPLLGIGIGSPGPLDPERGIIFCAPNMPGWYDLPLRDIVARHTGLPAVLGNDANAAALGEWFFGAGHGSRNMVYITVSTGIGAGVISDGRLILGRLGAATELGNLLIDCEQYTTWENLASGTALAATAARAMVQHPESLLHTLADPATITAADVMRAAAAGDALAQQLAQREAELLGVGFVNTLHAFSPEIILVGGSVVLANPWLLDAARETVQRHVIADLYRSVPIRVAQLGEHVGVLGAAALVYYQQTQTHP
jgi:glucokinase